MIVVDRKEEQKTILDPILHLLEGIMNKSNDWHLCLGTTMSMNQAEKNIKYTLKFFRDDQTNPEKVNVITTKLSNKMMEEYNSDSYTAGKVPEY